MILYPFYNKLKKSYIKPMNNKTNIIYYLFYLLFSFYPVQICKTMQTWEMIMDKEHDKGNS